MSFYHKIFRINYRMAQGIVSHPSQDESVFVGHAPKKDFSVHYIAPSEAVALAHFNFEFEFVIRTKDYEFELVGVDKIDIDACLLNMKLA